ncbi:MAG: hypothetical protein OIF47_04725 [Marinibacterium sp.]|nr:hypothetical protein [Marinibacterium sp.]
MLRKFATAALILGAGLGLATASFAADEYNASVGLTAAGAPLGLHGVDPVAFIDSGTPVEGSAAHTLVHDGVAYYFTSADTLARFQAEPAAYLPQNGGFCTFGVSVGKKFDGDPEYAAIIDNKLYVFLNEDIFAAFNKDREGTISKAAQNWTDIRSTAVGDL